MPETGPNLLPDLPTILFQVLNFVVLLLGLNYFLFRPLRQRLRERAEELSETRQNTRDQEAEAAELRSAWEERMRTVEQQAEAILAQAEEDAAQRTEVLLAEARSRIDRLTDEMRVDLRRQRDELIAERYDELLDTIIGLSGNVVQSVTTRRTHDDLVTNFAASIYQLPQEQIDQYRRVVAGRTPTAFVTTPVALTQDQTKTLSDTLTSLVNRHVELEVRIDPRLIAGIQVRLADKLMDNSIRNQLTLIRGRVREDMISSMGADGQHE